MKQHNNALTLFVLVCAVSTAGCRSTDTRDLRVDDESKVVAGSDAPDPVASKATFDRLVSMAGNWRGRSTKGWEDTVTIEVIAAGTVVVMRSFDAHPGETMLTLIHMDGERLMLSHYCVAKNQPRLIARSFEDEGRTVGLEFLDGTNMASRDVGHMDGLVWKFIDDTAFTSTWSWYQAGNVSFMEEIEYVREEE